MSYLASEIILYTFFVALLWFPLGWWVCSIDRAKRMKERESEWNHHLNTLRRDRDTFRDESETAHGKIRVLENRRADGKSPPQATQLNEDERRRYREETTKLHENLDAAKRQLNGFAMQVDTLRQQSVEREDILEQLKKKLTITSRTLHDRETRLEELSQEDGQPVGQSDQSAQHFASNTTGPHHSAAEHARELAQLRAEHLQAQEAAAADRTRLESTLRENEQAMATLREQFSTAQQHIQKSNAPSVPGLLETLRQRNDEINALQQTLTQANQNKDSVGNAASDPGLLETLQQRNDEIKALRQALTQAKQGADKRPDPDLTQQLQQRNNEINALRQAVSQAKQETDQVRHERQTKMGQTIERQEQALAHSKQHSDQREQEHTQEIAELHDAMSAQEQIIAQLRREMAGAKPAPPRRKSATDTAGLSGDLFAVSPGNLDVAASNDAIGNMNTSAEPSAPPIKLFDERPDRIDNLQRITGIGPKFERALNAAGIYCFDQIAALSDGDINWLADAIHSFPERIERGNWLSQARELTSSK